MIWLFIAVESARMAKEYDATMERIHKTMTAEPVDEVTVEIKADTSQFMNEVNKASKALDKFGKSLRRTRRQREAAFWIEIIRDISIVAAIINYIVG